MRLNTTIPKPKATRTPPRLLCRNFREPKHRRSTILKCRDLTPVKGDINRFIEAVNDHEDGFAC